MHVTHLTEAEKTDYMEQGREQMLAIHMLMGADREHFGSAIEDFECAYLMNRRNQYPKSLHDCYTPSSKGGRKDQV